MTKWAAVTFMRIFSLKMEKKTAVFASINGMGIRHKIWDIKTPVSNSYVSTVIKKKKKKMRSYFSSL